MAKFRGPTAGLMESVDFQNFSLLVQNFHIFLLPLSSGQFWTRMIKPSIVMALKHLRCFKRGGGRAEEFLLTWGQHLSLLQLYVHVSFLHLHWSCLPTIECLHLYCPDSSAIYGTSEKLFSSWKRKQFALGTHRGYTSPSVNSWWSVLLDWMGLQIREPCETTGHRLNKSVKFSQSRYLRLS
jgi:hypothetical protein